jgi:hypothetical protein
MVSILRCYFTPFSLFQSVLDLLTVLNMTRCREILTPFPSYPDATLHRCPKIVSIYYFHGDLPKLMQGTLRDDQSCFIWCMQLERSSNADAVKIGKQRCNMLAKSTSLDLVILLAWLHSQVPFLFLLK